MAYAIQQQLCLWAVGLEPVFDVHLALPYPCIVCGGAHFLTQNKVNGPVYLFY